MQPYIPFLMLFGLAVVAAATMIIGSHFLGPRRPTEVKSLPYESGMPPLGTAHERFSVKFYLVAMLFIVFDIETVFLIPWATIFLGGTQAGGGGGGGAGSATMGFLLVEMLVFLVILFVGYVYVWKRGAFQWD
jgi:NADH-quinone oxidoreductase subunit A